MQLRRSGFFQQVEQVRLYHAERGITAFGPFHGVLHISAPHGTGQGGTGVFGGEIDLENWRLRIGSEKWTRGRGKGGWRWWVEVDWRVASVGGGPACSDSLRIGTFRERCF